MYLAFLASGLTALSLNNKLANSDNTADEPRRAICIMHGEPGVIKGVVQFEQQDYFGKT